MMKTFTIWVPALVVAALVAQLPLSASAQVERHVVTIENGQVLIDGKRVPENELPSNLKIDNLTASMNFSGNALLELNGTVFQLLDGKLVEADESVARDGRVMVFFRDPNNGRSVMRVLSRGDMVGEEFEMPQVSPRPYGMVMKNYLDALQNKAKEFEVIRGQIANQNTEQAVVLAERLQLEAENAARMTKAFPRIQYESYLEGIHESDTGLYNQLIQENSIETETHRLAMEARAASNERQREQLIQALREKLKEAFELKQKNRESEIEQMSEKLKELRQKISERSEAKNRIIEARMKELLGELDW